MFDTEEFTIFDLVDESQPFEPEFTKEEWNSFGFSEWVNDITVQDDKVFKISTKEIDEYDDYTRGSQIDYDYD